MQILGVAKAGKRIAVARIVEEDNPEAGIAFHPYTVLRPTEEAREVDAELLFEKDATGKAIIAAAGRLRPCPN
jgi:hypothetical protein